MLTLQAEFVSLGEQHTEHARCVAGFDRQPVAEVDLIETVGNSCVEAQFLRSRQATKLIAEYLDKLGKTHGNVMGTFFPELKRKQVHLPQQFGTVFLCLRVYSHGQPHEVDVVQQRCLAGHAATR